MTKRIKQLEGLRFIMCCIIVISHFEFLGEVPKFGEFYRIYLHNPTMAVDFFFMVSGFGMFLSNTRPELNVNAAIRFAIEKVKKIYPAYLFSLILGTINVFIVSTDYIKTIVKIVIWFIVDFTLLQSLTGMTFFSHSLNNVCWFLSTLFVIYMLSPYMLKFVDKLKSFKAVLMSSLLIVVGIYVLSMCFAKIDSLGLFWGKINDLWYGHPFIRCWYVFIGMLLRKIYQNNNELIKLPNVLIAFGAVVYFFMRNSIELGGNLIRIIDVLLCALVLITTANSSDFLSKLLGSEIMVKLGSLSMYIFLFHFPYSMIAKALNSTLLAEYNTLPIYSIEIILVLLLTSLTTLIYIKISRDVRRRT